jgi:hypothetical protein
LTFSYPQQWRVTYPGGSNVVRFYLPARVGTMSAIDVLIYSRKSTTPGDLVQADPRDTLEPLYNEAWIAAAPEALRPNTGNQIREWHARREAARNFYVNQGRPSEYTNWLYAEHNHWTTLGPVAMPATATIGKGKTIRCNQRSVWLLPTGQADDRASQMLPQAFRSMMSEFKNKMMSKQFIRMTAFNAGDSVALVSLYCGEPNASESSVLYERLLADLSATGAAKPAHK